jgi:hypothetical protein
MTLRSQPGAAEKARTPEFYTPRYKLWLACHFHLSGVNGNQVKQEVQPQDHDLRQLSRSLLYNSGNAFPNQATQSLHLP